MKYTYKSTITSQNSNTVNAAEIYNKLLLQIIRKNGSAAQNTLKHQHNNKNKDNNAITCFWQHL